MSVNDIVHFIKMLKDETTLPTDYDDEIRTFVGTDYVAVSIDGLRYSTDIKLHTNGDFTVNTRDYMTDTDIIKTHSTLASLDEFQPHWDKVITLLKNQQPLPAGYVKFSSYRVNVIAYLTSLSDDFTGAINFFDDIGLFPPYTYDTIGYTLRNRAEAEAMSNG